VFVSVSDSDSKVVSIGFTVPKDVVVKRSNGVIVSSVSVDIVIVVTLSVVAAVLSSWVTFMESSRIDGVDIEISVVSVSIWDEAVSVVFESKSDVSSTLSIGKTGDVLMM